MHTSTYKPSDDRINLETWLGSLTDAIISPDPSRQYQTRTESRINQLLIPNGSLGRLADIAIQLSHIQCSERPNVAQKTLLIFAADHGVTEEGVSAYLPNVTANVCYSLANSAGAASVLARCSNATVQVIDVGVAHDFNGAKNIIHRKVAMGTKNMARQQSATRAETLQAMYVGAEAVNQCSSSSIIAVGEVGIGNTTAAAAVFSAITGYDAVDVVGRGTGVGDETLARKINVVRSAVELHRPAFSDPVSILASVGGLEISALTGAILAAAALQRPILLDGFITCVAALAAVTIAAQAPVAEYLIAAHRSAEQGHKLLLKRLQLTPIVDIGLRIGEGTGAMLALPIIESACALLSQIHTFDEAGLTAPVIPENLV